MLDRQSERTIVIVIDNSTRSVVGVVVVARSMRHNDRSVFQNDVAQCIDCRNSHCNVLALRQRHQCQLVKILEFG
jgi:predicted MarR family transcription regulator